MPMRLPTCPLRYPGSQRRCRKARRSDAERTTWGAFTSVFEWRREGEKDGPSFVPSTFTLEPDGRGVSA